MGVDCWGLDVSLRATAASVIWTWPLTASTMNGIGVRCRSSCLVRSGRWDFSELDGQMCSHACAHCGSSFTPIVSLNLCTYGTLLPPLLWPAQTASLEISMGTSSRHNYTFDAAAVAPSSGSRSFSSLHTVLPSLYISRKLTRLLYNTPRRSSRRITTRWPCAGGATRLTGATDTRPRRSLRRMGRTPSTRFRGRGGDEQWRD
ncbi:hypothetical protein C8J57DRAFT_1728072, partial [Mycena rebaudengoi]